jgi:hypothetical protein
MELICIDSYIKEKNEQLSTLYGDLDSSKKEKFFTLLNIKILDGCYFVEHSDKYFCCIDGHFIHFRKYADEYYVYSLIKKNILDIKEEWGIDREKMMRFIGELYHENSGLGPSDMRLVFFDTIDKCNDFYNNLINIKTNFRYGNFFEFYNNKNELIEFDDKINSCNAIKRIH